MSSPDSSQLQSWVASPSDAINDLKSLFDALHADNLEEGLVTEVFENCGSPLPDQLDLLVSLLTSDENDQAYWACTLLGRLKVAANAAQNSLVSLAIDTGRNMAARQRAVLAFQSIGPLNSNTIRSLQSMDTSSDARLKRLVEQLQTQVA